VKPEFVDNRNGNTLVAALRGHLACPDKWFAKWDKAVGVVYYGKPDANERCCGSSDAKGRSGTCQPPSRTC
jgi:hypothetical protein